MTDLIETASKMDLATQDIEHLVAVSAACTMRRGAHLSPGVAGNIATQVDQTNSTGGGRRRDESGGLLCAMRSNGPTVTPSGEHVCRA